MSTFISVGNATQSFDRLLNTICAISKDLPQPVIIQYGAMEKFKCDNCICRPFLKMEEFEQFIIQSELLIMHAGAGSVINSIQMGKKPVIVPRFKKYNEHVDNHQIEFCEKLEKAGKVYVVYEERKLLSVCEKALESGKNKLEDQTISPLVSMVDKVIREYSN